ncbi:DUF4252 domain-containing protein [Dysgonomonas sp. HGC4]|uniref:DUF4252 domain-containing protein n=1 Tax=Dysgonomonas sp. HGC4 TaxID=1658009 RepID=UPI000681E207|nr:DUF4252 domain-containing protein [Dysgonomonas sp. HGC4]MBD8349259.1 DUF4252 domain-containing protein [Dysgonomonas sp. HGC4]
MKRLIVLIFIAVSVTSLSKAQSEIVINMDDLQAEIFSELAKIPPSIPAIDLDMDAMKVEISESLANMENQLNWVDLGDLENLSNLESLDFQNLTVNPSQPSINIVVSDTNQGNTYAYVKSETSKEENNHTYSYTINETPQNNDELFSRLSNLKGVQVVYISKSMLGMMPNMDMPGVDIGNIASKLESLEIYTAEEELASKRLTSASEGLLKGGDYETLMLIKDEDSKTAFYVKKNKSNQSSEMLMITQDGADATIIRFLGNFSIQDIKNIANKHNTNMNINTTINTNTSTRLSEAELNIRVKEAQKRNKEAQKIAEDAQKRALEIQKRAEERAKRAEKRAEERVKRAEERADERAKRTEERAKEAEARKAN